MTDDILADQVDYYRARAPEYDEWWSRSGRYDKGAEINALWRAEVAQARAWLDGLGLGGRILEVAAGTGNWTAELARHGDRVTALDAVIETLGINRAKVAAQHSSDDPCPVDHIVADAYTWVPGRVHDHAFAGFWISHVPDERLGDFFANLDRALAPGAKVALLDNKAGVPDESGPADADDGPSPIATDGEPGVTDLDSGGTGQGRSRRVLNDGRAFTIVKEYRTPERLAELLGPLGWEVTGGSSPRFFTWAVATRR